MKGKLHKMVSGYILSLNGDIDDPYAIVNEELAKDHGWYRLSLKNCQAIEHGYDLDELAMGYDLYENINFVGQMRTYKAGFQKALELMGDKKFSINEVVELTKILISNPFERCGKTYQELTDSYIQSLQQTEWDVEIEMGYVGECNGNNDNGCFQDSSGHNCGCFKRKPKLDENNCLILKRI